MPENAAAEGGFGRDAPSRPDENDHGGQREKEEVKSAEAFERSMDNAERPDRAPATPSATSPESDDDDDGQDDRGLLDRAGDFLGGIARDIQDTARENPRVDSHGNTVGLVDADGIQRGEVASRVMSSGTSAEDLAGQLGFSSPQDMAAAQNTDFIDDKLQEDLQLRAMAEAMDERYGVHPELSGLTSERVDQLIADGKLEVVEAGYDVSPAQISEAIKQAAEMMPAISPDVWEKTEAVMKGALDGSIAMLGPAAAISQTDTLAPGPADLVAIATVIAGGIAGGADAYQAYGDKQEAEFGRLVAEHGFSFSNPSKLSKQMQKRGWTEQQIVEALQTEGIPTHGKMGEATRYEHPTTGKSVVVDNRTNEIFHVGKKGYDYD